MEYRRLGSSGARVSTPCLGGMTFVTLQAQHRLASREIERERVPSGRDEGVGVLPWSPLAGGFPTGKRREEPTPPEGGWLDEASDFELGYPHELLRHEMGRW